MQVVANLIGCINELHTLVGDREDDGRDFSHLFRRPLEEKKNTGRKDIKVIYRSLKLYALCPCLCPWEKKLVTYPHFGTGILRGLGTP